MKKKICVVCEKEIPSRNIYCGSQITKTGCAYTVQLKKIAKWNFQHKEELRPVMRKAEIKYWKANKSTIRVKNRNHQRIKRRYAI